MKKEDFVKAFVVQRSDNDKIGDITLDYDFQEEKNSPIEEVRVTISNTDDPSIPCNTFRMWFLGLFFTCAVAFINEFFYLRETVISIGYPVVALVSLPLGHIMARVLPAHKITLLGCDFSLNPGPFSIKEHVLIGTMTAVSSTTAYAVDIIILQKLFYNDEKPFIAGLLLVTTTQITGFALAGALRPFLVQPARMVWPSNLATASIFRSLHANGVSPAESGHMSRMTYFMLAISAAFLWYWLPGFIFPTIGMISWICWINPDNVILSQLTGSYGLGMGTISLDWAAISYYIQPLITPWYAQVNLFIGFILATWIMTPWAYYTNLWHSKNYPILSADLFLENGSYYDVTQILTDNILDEQKYHDYGPVRMNSSFALTYGFGFAAIIASVVHTVLYSGKDIIAQWKATRAESEDIHNTLMRAYPQVPSWWYSTLFAITFILSLVTCIVWDYLPWWALILALFIGGFFALPVGIIVAVTNLQPGLNIVTEFIIGYILPGNPIANVTFKTYGYIVNVQALNFASDLKLGHYMKIPPRIMFIAQLVSAVIAGAINLLTATWLLNTRPSICTPDGYPFTCRTTNTFNSASVIWGAIGPTRVFGTVDGALYWPVQLGFLFGLVLPIPLWLASRKYPEVTWLKFVHWPVLLYGTSNIPPILPYFFTNGVAVGFIFSFLIRRYRYDWWARYNYLTSAALDSGSAVAALVIFLFLQLRGIQMPFWWGNPEDGILDHCPYSFANFNGDY